MHIVSYVGNKGLIDRDWAERVQDKSVWYLSAYIIVCLAGLFIHPFFYSLLVRI